MWVIWKRWFVVLSLFNELQLAKGIAINDSIKFMHGWLYGPVVFNFSLMISNVSQFVTRAPLTMRCFLLEWLKYPLGKCSNKNLVKSNQHRSRAMRVAVRPKHPSAIIMVIWPVWVVFFSLANSIPSWSYFWREPFAKHTPFVYEIIPFIFTLSCYCYQCFTGTLMSWTFFGVENLICESFCRFIWFCIIFSTTLFIKLWSYKSAMCKMSHLFG